jgi:hypothetical protein
MAFNDRIGQKTTISSEEIKAAVERKDYASLHVHDQLLQVCLCARVRACVCTAA